MSRDERLIQDLADLLTGPTSGEKARRLAEAIIRSSDYDGARDVALALIDAGNRYLRGEAER